jgi:hypothetical protein
MSTPFTIRSVTSVLTGPRTIWVIVPLNRLRALTFMETPLE